MDVDVSAGVQCIPVARSSSPPPLLRPALSQRAHSHYVSSQQPPYLPHAVRSAPH